MPCLRRADWWPVGLGGALRYNENPHYLQTHPHHSGGTYGDLKRRLAVECSKDIDAYVEGKTGFIVSFLQQAGFAEASLLDIEVMK